MALFIRQDDNRSKLQERLAAELREKARARAEGAEKIPDGVDDSAFLGGTKQTTRLAWVWLLIFLFVIVAMVWLMFLNT
jgi:hypothetical protein